MPSDNLSGRAVKHSCVRLCLYWASLGSGVMGTVTWGCGCCHCSQVSPITVTIPQREPRCPSQLCQAVRAPSTDNSGSGDRDVAGCAQHCLAAAGIRAQSRDCAGDVRRCFEISQSPMPFDLKRISSGARTPSPPRARSSSCLPPAQSWGCSTSGWESAAPAVTASSQRHCFRARPELKGHHCQEWGHYSQIPPMVHPARLERECGENPSCIPQTCSSPVHSYNMGVHCRPWLLAQSSSCRTFTQAYGKQSVDVMHIMQC